VRISKSSGTVMEKEKDGKLAKSNNQRVRKLTLKSSAQSTAGKNDLIGKKLFFKENGETPTTGQVPRVGGGSSIYLSLTGKGQEAPDRQRKIRLTKVPYTRTEVLGCE